ncbi:MAG: alpha/beta hydrolase [Pirellula sp.]
MLRQILSLGFVLSVCVSLQAQEKQIQDKKSERQRTDAKNLPECDRKITYKQVGEKSYDLHVFEPKSAVPAATGRPAIVFFFGGGWNNGDPKQFFTQCQALADLGMMAMSAEYRVASRDNAKVIDCIADAQDAIAYVRSHAADLQIDPTRIAAGGGSAGGHLAAAVATLEYRGSVADRATKDYRPNALVLFNPALVLAPTGTARDVEIKRTTSNMADRVGDKPESASPYHHLHQDLPPTIIFHGRADSTVPYWTVEVFRDRAKELGAHCQLKGYDDQTHGFFNVGRPKHEETTASMIKFLREQKFVP